MAILTKGTKAPEFSLPAAPDKTVSLKDYQGRPLILVFYPADWSPVCTDQLSLYNELMPMFQKHHADIVGISVDSPWCHLAFSKSRNLHFPLLSDFEPKGAVSKTYESYQKDMGTSGRSLFLIDGKGIIRWSHHSPLNVNPGADGILTALEEINR